MKLYFKEPSAKRKTLLIAMIGQPPPPPTQDRVSAVQSEVGCPVI